MKKPRRKADEVSQVKQETIYHNDTTQCGRVKNDERKLRDAGEKKTAKITSPRKVIYLPSIWEPKKVREGIIEIINCVMALEKKGTE